MPLRNKKTPRIIATGFTTALLGDERTLREFIIGDYVREKLERKGENVVLYLINDNYDPLNYRQLRIGVNKDEKLLKKFERYAAGLSQRYQILLTAIRTILSTLHRPSLNGYTPSIYTR